MKLVAPPSACLYACTWVDLRDWFVSRLTTVSVRRHFGTWYAWVHCTYFNSWSDCNICKKGRKKTRSRNRFRSKLLEIDKASARHWKEGDRERKERMTKTSKENNELEKVLARRMYAHILTCTCLLCVPCTAMLMILVFLVSNLVHGADLQ